MPIYFGMGIIVAIAPSPRDADRLICVIDDFQPFPIPVPFKTGASTYLEPGGIRGGSYYQPGVRRISDTVFQTIVERAFPSSMPQMEQAIAHDSPMGPLLGGYASPEVARAIDAYAMNVAEGYIRARYAEQTVIRQAHNNPGFDLLVTVHEEVMRYIEVKGSQFSLPRFFLTEGERQFSISHAAMYTMLVVYAIDTSARTHELLCYDGSIVEAEFVLQPTQWLCQIQAPQSNESRH